MAGVDKSGRGTSPEPYVDRSRSRSRDRPWGAEADRRDGADAEGGVDPKKLYVGNLSSQTTKEDLAKGFGEFGHLQEVEVIADRETGRPRGFAFIRFEDAADAGRAVKALNDKELNGRPMEVKVASPPGSAPPRREGRATDDRRKGRAPKPKLGVGWLIPGSGSSQPPKLLSFEKGGWDTSGGGATSPKPERGGRDVPMSGASHPKPDRGGRDMPSSGASDRGRMDRGNDRGGGGRHDSRGPPPERPDSRGPPPERPDSRGPPPARNDSRGPPERRDSRRSPGRPESRGPPARSDSRGPPEKLPRTRGSSRDVRDARGSSRDARGSSRDGRESRYPPGGDRGGADSHARRGGGPYSERRFDNNGGGRYSGGGYPAGNNGDRDRAGPYKPGYGDAGGGRYGPGPAGSSYGGGRSEMSGGYPDDYRRGRPSDIDRMPPSGGGQNGGGRSGYESGGRGGGYDSRVSDRDSRGAGAGPSSRYSGGGYEPAYPSAGGYSSRDEPPRRVSEYDRGAPMDRRAGGSYTNGSDHGGRGYSPAPVYDRSRPDRDAGYDRVGGSASNSNSNLRREEASLYSDGGRGGYDSWGAPARPAATTKFSGAELRGAGGDYGSRRGGGGGPSDYGGGSRGGDLDRGPSDYGVGSRGSDRGPSDYGGGSRRGGMDRGPGDYYRAEQRDSRDSRPDARPMSTSRMSDAGPRSVDKRRSSGEIRGAPRAGKYGAVGDGRRQGGGDEDRSVVSCQALMP
ncbi:unnamed protein product [Chrysoparadoxa australica]